MEMVPSSLTINSAHHKMENKKSKTSKVIRFFIRVLLIPVSVDDQGYHFGFLTLRFFLSILLWTLLPLLFTVGYMTITILNDLENIKVKPFATIFATYINQLIALILVFGPLSMGYLVGKANDAILKTITTPLRYLQIVIPVILFVTASGALGSTPIADKTLNTVSLICTWAYAFFYFTVLFVWLMVVNAYIEGFRVMAKRMVSMEDKRELAVQCDELLTVYQSLKIAFGPSLLFLFSLSVTLMTCFAYSFIDFTRRGDYVHAIFASAATAKFLGVVYNLSTGCQACYDALVNNINPLKKTLKNCSDLDEKEISTVLSMIESEGPLSAMDFFEVDKTTFVSVVSTALTYFIILLQS